MTLPDDVLELAAARVRNWGRWGADDEVGTLNLITPDVVRAAAARSARGTVDRSRSPSTRTDRRPGASSATTTPTRRMLRINAASTGDPSEYCTSDDAVAMGLQAGTHWDTLAHVSYDGRMYNGVPSSVVDERGAPRLGIEKLPPIVGRGVLLDVPRAVGVDRLAPGTAITAAHLDRTRSTWGGSPCTPVTSCSSAPGRCGCSTPAIARPTAPRAPACRWRPSNGSGGTTSRPSRPTTSPCEVYPCERPDTLLPVHLLHLVDMGLTRGRTSTSRACRRTVRTPPGTASSSGPRPRCRSPARSAHR